MTQFREVTTEQVARLLRYATPDPTYADEPPPGGPYCYLCHEWEFAEVNQRAVEEFGATWTKEYDEEYGYMPSMRVWEVLNFDVRITPDEEICVVPRHTIVRSMFGTFPTRPLVPVHLNCFYYAMLNGRRQGGLDERTCRHCERTFYSRQALDWCHACEKVERTCAHCTGPLRSTNEALAKAFGVEPRQGRARSDAKFCSPACRVAAHRARAKAPMDS